MIYIRISNNKEIFWLFYKIYILNGGKTYTVTYETLKKIFLLIFTQANAKDYKGIKKFHCSIGLFYGKKFQYFRWDPIL